MNSLALRLLAFLALACVVVRVCYALTDAALQALAWVGFSAVILTVVLVGLAKIREVLR